MKRIQAIIFWLMLTVPLHGIAGSLMICKSLHSHVAQADGHHHFSANDQPHEGAASSSSGVTQAGKLDVSLEDARLASCQVCASCSASSCAMLVAAYSMPEANAAFDLASYTDFHIPAVDPDRPDDPPRT